MLHKITSRSKVTIPKLVVMITTVVKSVILPNADLQVCCVAITSQVQRWLSCWHLADGHHLFLSGTQLPPQACSPLMRLSLCHSLCHSLTAISTQLLRWKELTGFHHNPTGSYYSVIRDLQHFIWVSCVYWCAYSLSLELNHCLNSPRCVLRGCPLSQRFKGIFWLTLCKCLILYFFYPEIVVTGAAAGVLTVQNSVRSLYCLLNRKCDTWRTLSFSASSLCSWQAFHWASHIEKINTS